MEKIRGRSDQAQDYMWYSNTRLINIPDVCKILGVGHWMVYKQINEKALKTIKIGRRRLVSVDALNEFIKSLEQ
jgi:excisionase family DNA binding protein